MDFNGRDEKEELRKNYERKAKTRMQESRDKYGECMRMYHDFFTKTEGRPYTMQVDIM